MSSLVIEIQEASAQSVSVSEDSLTVDLVDGRTIIVPLVWYPRLWYGSQEERNNYEIIGDGTLIHWPDLDEDLSVSGLLAGRRSGESRKSFKKWLEGRAAPGEGPPDLPLHDLCRDRLGEDDPARDRLPPARLRLLLHLPGEAVLPAFRRGLRARELGEHPRDVRGQVAGAVRR